MRQNLANNSRLYEDKQGNVKSRRVAKTVGAKTAKTNGKNSAKSVSFSPDVEASRAEDKYGVRGRAPRAKSSRASRSRQSVGVVV